jgi:hypothetical protein
MGRIGRLGKKRSNEGKEAREDWRLNRKRLRLLVKRSVYGTMLEKIRGQGIVMHKRLVKTVRPESDRPRVDFAFDAVAERAERKQHQAGHKPVSNREIFKEQ